MSFPLVHRILCFLFFTIIPVQAQDVDNWAARTLRQGLPSFPPLARKSIEQPYHAIIPVPDSTQIINIVWGIKEGWPYPWVLHKRPNSTKLSRFHVQLVSPGVYESQLDLHFRPGFEGAIPLSLMFLPAKRILLYKWSGSSTDPPGGLPTVNTKPMDPGTLFPDLELHSGTGELFDFARFRGNTLFIVYGNAGCSAFQADKPAIDSLAAFYAANDRQVSFLAIAPDSKADREFLNDHPFSFPHAFANENAKKIMGGVFPRYTITSPNGIVLYDKTGGGFGTGRRMGQILERVIHEE